MLNMNVLSLFDGMSCGQQALERTGIKVENYFASEIDKYAIQVTMANYPNTIQLGSVVNVDGYSLPKIDLLIGGSPCQSFSFAGKRKGMATKCETEILTLEHYLQLKKEGFEFEGQSYLFWEFMRLLNETKPKYFLLENVEMGEKWEKVLSKAIGLNGIHINSALVSAQNRKRIYWTNIGMQAGGLFGDMVSIIKQPKDKGILLKDILESDVLDKYFLSDKMLKHLSERDNVKIKNGNDLSGTITVNGEGKQGNNSTFIACEISNQGKTIGKKVDKSHSLMARDYKGFGNQSMTGVIVHNTMPRSSTTGKGGTGHLSRKDGKTYCLDTGNTNAVEINVFDGYNNRMRTDEKCGSITQHCSREGMTNGFKVVMPNNAVEIKAVMLGRSEAWGMPENSQGKSYTLCKEQPHGIKYNNSIRRLTPIECERLQTVKDNYTNHVSDSQRYKMLGNGWTIDVIAHILNYVDTMLITYKLNQ
jgi:DNA (cytosine-5)-methyltransferase 3A